MKVAVVFDIPDDIEIEKTKVQYITIAGKKTNNYMVQTMKIDCPLRPLPKKEHYEIDCDGLPTDIEYATYCDGRNKVIDEITGDYITQEEADLCGVQFWHDD